MRTSTARSLSIRVLIFVSSSLVLSFVACSSDDDGDKTDTPTTTDAPTTETTQPADGPEEWVEVAQDVYDRDFALLREPDPEKVKDLYAETCNCWEDRHGTVEFLATEGEHVEGEPAQVVLVKLEQHDETTGFVDLTIKVQAKAQRRVNAAGDVVQEIPAQADPTCVSTTLRPDGVADAYRVHTQLSLTGCPDGS